MDNDLLVRVGSDLNYDPGTLGQANFEVMGAGERGQDSSRVILNPAVWDLPRAELMGTVIERFERCVCAAPTWWGCRPC